MSLLDRVAVVTGAGQGIGAAVAHRLAVAGASVAIVDIDGDLAMETAARVGAETGRTIRGFTSDVTDPVAVEAIAACVADTLGPIDVLVNNAGILRNAPMIAMTNDEWTTVLDVNLSGAFYWSRAAAPQMIQRRYGKIVNISSGSAHGSHRGQANYSSAKAGIIGLTKTMAVELGPSNINVNAVAPGAIESEMTRATARQIGVSFEEYEQHTAATVALRRLGRPEEVADVICFLASEAARYITGETITVAGSPGR
jgi:3-oxoacyl-[acyl-carrier protein] reductase